jgi:formate hydrogenlyase transcriptional activator
LENFLEQAVILSPGTVLEAPIDELTHLPETAAEPITLKDAERAHIIRTLRATNGVIAAAAVRLGLPRSTLFYTMRRLGIASPSQALGRYQGRPRPSRTLLPLDSSRA